ncbi:hypothetical protein [Actinomadura xylanilytica]|uniref:hypothetical protein n=1 Tax=Actinomadura xylanilytica TaxID=887459 RepID=UPI00255ABBB7|nr:hypothetical protein [Actinomadura xylanilytica]MDL4772606.1 hypothetical protein [Actinomadura xylanilytica]
MAPQDKQPDLNDLLPGVLPQGPGIDPADPKTWPIPKGAPGGQGSRGANKVEVQREQLLQVARQMRKDLDALQYSLTGLQTEAGMIGAWDVAQQLGPKVDTAHRGMLAGINQFCEAYAAAIRKVEQAAKNYGKSEQLATEAARGAGAATPPSHVTPWQNR